MDIVTSGAWGPPEDRTRRENFYIYKRFDLNTLSQGLSVIILLKIDFITSEV